MLKHFAAATLAITICIALFADGSTTEAVADTIEQNQLKQTGADLLGARRLARPTLKISDGSRPMVEDPALDDTGGEASLWDGPTQPPVHPSSQASGPGWARPEDFLPGNDATRLARKAGQPKRPSPEELTSLKEASRQRTGSAAVN